MGPQCYQQNLFNDEHYLISTYFMLRSPSDQSNMALEAATVTLHYVGVAERNATSGVS